jgi:NAD(P)-dependent dehydrogenase (short-subunit alcohol dehydrogenase family)
MVWYYVTKAKSGPFCYQPRLDFSKNRSTWGQAEEIEATVASAFLEELFSLSGQVAVVIGGTGVLGGSLAEGLAKAGAKVVIGGRSAERGAARVAAIDVLGHEAVYIPVEATTKSSVENLAGEIWSKFRRCDIVVNCAGVNSGTPYEQIPEEEWHKVVDGNLLSTHFACQVFAPRMAEQESGGAILNIGSVTAHLPLSKVFAYAASKAAVVNLTQNVAREYAKRKVRVNVLCPGFFPAEQNRKLLDAERREKVLSQTPMGRFGEPSELVGAMLLLVSRNAGSFITGADYYVDGGFTANRL